MRRLTPIPMVAERSRCGRDPVAGSLRAVLRGDPGRDLVKLLEHPGVRDVEVLFQPARRVVPQPQQGPGQAARPERHALGRQPGLAGVGQDVQGDGRVGPAHDILPASAQQPATLRHAVAP